MNKKINKLIKEFGISSDIQLKQIANKLKLNLVYIGFAENLPASVKNGCYIINLGNFDIGGTHWTCLYIEKPNAFYYDSYAGAPEDKIIKWLEQNKIKNLIWNDYFQMQGLTETLCGIFCIIFLYHMTYNKKKNLMDRFKDFTKNFIDLDGNYSAGNALKVLK